MSTCWVVLAHMQVATITSILKLHRILFNLYHCLSCAQGHTWREKKNDEIFLTGRTLEGTHADKVRTCKVHTERQMERNPRPSCCDEVALTLTQRAVAHSRLLPLQNNKGKGERNTVPSKRIPAGSLMSRSYEEMPQTSAHQPMVCHVLHLLNCKLSRSPVPSRRGVCMWM